MVLAFALAVCSKGSLAALDASPAETASSNNLVQDKHDFQVKTSTLSVRLIVNNLSVACGIALSYLKGTVELLGKAWLEMRIQLNYLEKYGREYE